MSRKVGLFRTLTILVVVTVLFSGAFWSPSPQEAYAEGGVGDPILIDTNTVPDNNVTGGGTESVSTTPRFNAIASVSILI